MNITRRRGTIAIFITLGVLLTGLTVFLNITFTVQRRTFPTLSHSHHRHCRRP